MITKLSAEQWAQVPKQIDKWIENASSQMDHARAITSARAIYKSMGEEEPIVIFGFSPFNTCLLAAMLKDLDPEKLYSQLYSQLSSQLYSQLYSQLSSQLGS